MNHSLRLASCLLLAACAVDPAAEDPIDDVAPVADGDEGIAPPPAHLSVRDVKVGCAQDFDGLDRVSVQATTDLDVRFALASFHRGDESDAVELDFRMPEPIRVGGATIFSKTALVNLGDFTPDEASPVRCASVPAFAVKVVVAFEDGHVGCALAGNAVEVAKLRCED